MVKYILSLFFLIFSITGNSQEIQFQLYNSQGFKASGEPEALFDNNGGLSISYKQNLKRLNVFGGIGFRTIDWGNQVETELGLNKIYWNNNILELGQSFSANLAIPLFYKRLLIGAGVGSNLNLYYKFTKKWKISLLTGIHYDLMPSYRNYGSIWNTSEIRYGIQISRNITNRKQLE